MRLLNRSPFWARQFPESMRCLLQTRKLHTERFTRLSRFQTPSGGIAYTDAEAADSNALLYRAGFLRQTHAGIFHYLPLGYRVQNKIERLLDKHMQSIRASRVDLSTLSSEDLWRQSGRLQGDRSELWSLEDRKGSRFLLSPTHEEEITSLVRGLYHSYTDLPLRYYQITRKYRDELRPRQGLLRTREFLMKDLYTFDASPESALQTYEEVRAAYAAFFTELKLEYIVAAADSGNIGGDLSHEYHIPSEKGEDTVYTCENCKASFNEEILEKPLKDSQEQQDPCPCPQCSASMKQHTTIELGHTFYLGTKYSKPLEAGFEIEGTQEKAYFEMGCHGIGISRLIAGVANLYSSDNRLGWSRAIAPFELAIMQKGETMGAAIELANLITGTTNIDTVLDDRNKRGLVWKMKDADLVGYPVMAVLGKSWEKEGKVEIQCHRLGVKQDVNWADVTQTVTQLLDKY